jgi:acetyl esterase/lipase
VIRDCRFKPGNGRPMSANLIGGARHRGNLLAAVFGGDMDYFREQSPWRLVESNAGKLRTGMRIRQIVGERDHTLGLNREFKRHLDALGIPVAYRELPEVPHDPNRALVALGEENWEFVRSVFRQAP